jgi:regulatory protein
MTDASLFERALKKSYRILSIRARSEHELRSKLKDKDYDSDVIDDVIDRLRKQGYLNDESFAFQWARHLAVNKRLGNVRIAVSLREKGVDRDLAGRAIVEARRELSEDEAIRRVIAGKIKDGEPWNIDALQKRRLIQSLARRGFAPGRVFGLLNRKEEGWVYDDGQ